MGQIYKPCAAVENWTCIHILCLLQIKNQEISASIWLNLWLCIMHNTLVSIFYYFCWLLCTLAMLIHLHLMQLRTITNPIWWGLHFVFIRIVCAFFFFFLMRCLFGAALQNKRREIPPRLAKSQWTTAPLSGLVCGLSSSAESSLIPSVCLP